MECESPLNQGFLLRFSCSPPLFLFTGLRWRHLSQFDMEKSLCNLALTPGHPPTRVSLQPGGSDSGQVGSRVSSSDKGLESRPRIWPIQGRDLNHGLH